MKVLTRGLLVALMMGPVGPLAAQPSLTGQAIAETLFQEAKRLMVAGKFADACPKLEESQRLDPGDGTRIVLAQCYERTGRTASAWLLYTELAADTSPPRPAVIVSAARDRLTRLDRTLSRVVIRVPAAVARLAELRVSIDGVPLGVAALGVPVPVDPGSHQVSASAPHHVPWTGSFEAVASQVVTVDVAALALEPPAPPPASVAPPVSVAPTVSASPAVSMSTAAAPVSTPAGWQRTGAYVVAGVGVASLLTGVVFGLTSLGHQRESDRLCPASPCADPRAVSLSHDAVRAGDLSTLFVGVGLVGVGVGAALWFTAPSAARSTRARPLWLLPVVGAHGGGARLGGAF